MRIAITKVGQEFSHDENVIRADFSSSQFDAKFEPRRVSMMFQGRGENQDVIVRLEIDHDDLKTLLQFGWEEDDG